MMIKILFTIGAVFYICGVIFWSKYTKVIIEKLEERSSTDFLTGTLNRYGLEAIYNDISKKGKSFFIIVCDLNGTKRVNDNKGHLFGDRYITETSKILKDIIGSKGYVARTGGDEFIILLNHMTIDELERYLLKIKQLISEIDQDQQTGMSTGYSLFPKDGTSFEELMRIADDKMYCDKKLHRQHIDISKEK